MSTEQKFNFRLPAHLKASWVEALRSGEYKQGTGTLCATSMYGSKSYCCLGVLQMVADGECEQKKITLDGSCNPYRSLPSIKWMHDHGFKDLNDPFFDDHATDENRGWYPEVTIAARGNRLEGLYGLPYLNDREGLSFEQIADLIEAQCEGY